MPGELSIVMAQINLLVGDIEGNTERIIDCCARAIEGCGADIVAFPELSLIGYPPEDLLLRPSLELRISKALDKILAAQLDTHCVVGFPQRVGEDLFNILAIIHRDKILASYRKQCLPNYQVFDEQRYFTPGSGPCVMTIRQQPVAFTICEDLWEQEPLSQARQAGCRLLININASPFHIDKQQERKSLLQQRSQEGGFPIAYVNLVGGQDELVFDGGSMVVCAAGDVCLEAPLFAQGLFAAQLHWDDSQEMPNVASLPSPWAFPCPPPLSVEAQVYQGLVLGVRDYVGKNRFRGVVLGLSGGIDSALTLVIAVDALGPERVHAVMMPSLHTSQLSLDCAARQTETLGVHYRLIAIDEVYQNFLQALAEEFVGTETDVSEQNIQARIRGVILMAISNKKGHLVLTTGNKSELAVGYSTLYGDMAGGFDVLKDVSKTLVYRLARYRNRQVGSGHAVPIPQQVIDRPPSAELAPGQLDQDTLPDYAVLDEILARYVEQDQSAAAIIAAGFAEGEVRRVLRLVDLNEYKRRQSPVGVRLTQRGFGRDRRYPITNAWPLGE